MKRTLPKHRLEEIKALIPLKTYREIAEVMGCSVSAIYYYAKKFRLNLTRTKHKYKLLEQTVREYWATHTSVEIAEMVGCEAYDVLHMKDRLGLKRTKEEALKVEKKRVDKIASTLKKNAERDRRRIKFGLEPISKIFLTIAPKRVLSATYGLHHKHGYAYTDDPYVMSRNGHSLEGKKCDEEYYTKTYGIRFID